MQARPAGGDAEDSVGPAHLIKLCQQALPEVTANVARGEPLVRCQLLASEFPRERPRLIDRPYWSIEAAARYCVSLHRLRSAAPQRAGRHAGAARDHLPLCCARAASSRLMRYNTRLWSYGLFSVGPTSHSSAAFWTFRPGVPASCIFNSGRTERAHCANPKPFIEPGMSISLNTTSTGMSVFCKIAMASSVLAASTT